MLSPEPPERIPGMTRFAARTTTALFCRSGDPVEVTMLYLDSEPYGVAFIFDPLGSRTAWTFARDIVIEALAFRADSFPRGDVRMKRDARGVLLALSGEHTTEFRLDAEAVRAFLAMTFELVPPRQESDFIDWPAAEEALGLPAGSLTEPPA